MPNWCANILIVEGEPSQVKAFADKGKSHIVYSDAEEDTPLDFNKFVPYPDEEKHRDQIRWYARDLQNLDQSGKDKYIKDNQITKEELNEIMLNNLEEDNHYWAGWHTAHWGTKWNARYVQLKEVDANTLVYFFDTAWSPPLPVLVNMCEQHPNLTFTMLCGEEGHFFSGFIRAKKNKVFENRQGKYMYNWAFPKTLMKKYKLLKCEEAILGAG